MHLDADPTETKDSHLRRRAGALRARRDWLSCESGFCRTASGQGRRCPVAAAAVGTFHDYSDDHVPMTAPGFSPDRAGFGH